MLSQKPKSLTGQYCYEIGKHEVTAGQYCEFLNAVAGTDTYDLYRTEMGDTNSCGCNIKRTGSSGSYTYNVDPDWANRPVNFVSWGDAARFCNWLHNGKPTGPQDLSTTEDGAYLVDGAMTDEQLMAVPRKPDATYVIPTEDEWYKAARRGPTMRPATIFPIPTPTRGITRRSMGVAVTTR